jgi:hypothetical protein
MAPVSGGLAPPSDTTGEHRRVTDWPPQMSCNDFRMPSGGVIRVRENRGLQSSHRGGRLMMIPKFDSELSSIKSPKTANNSDRRLRRARVKWGGAGLLSIALLAAALYAGPANASENDAVGVWNERAAITLTNGPAAATPGVQFTPPVAIMHLAIVQGAVYDAVNAIKGGHDPYLDGLKAPTSASKGAAASTAAHDVLIGLVNQAPLTATLTVGVKADIKARLDAQYASSLAEIPDGQAKAKGIEVGAAAAAAMLANRAGDGRFGTPGFPVPASPGPGQWRPNPINDPNAWVRNVRPFTLPSSDYFQTSGPPLPLTSGQYTAEFNEVKALGRATGSTRTAAQTSLAYWTAGHPVPMLYAAMRQVAASKGLTINRCASLRRPSLPHGRCPWRGTWAFGRRLRRQELLHLPQCWPVQAGRTRVTTA